MNLINAFDELNKLYESVEEPEQEVTEQEAAEDEVQAAESAEDAEIEIVDDAEETAADEEQPEVEPQLVLECANCGGLAIKVESDVKVDEETDLVNMEEACPYCEAAEGYKIIGVLTPYSSAEELEEILDINLDATGLGGSGNKVSVLGEASKAKDKEDLEELLDINLDASGFGGTGNDVSVLSPSLPGM